MNVVVLFETKNKRDDLKKAIERKGHEVTLAANTGDFFEAIYEGVADTYVIDVRAWYRGSAIYSYFEIPAKLSDTPVVFLNTPEGFTSVDGREPIPGDITLEKDASFEEIAAVIG